ncbi:MAG: ribonuclease P protein component [Candidatus Microsaccharimonas sp.]
MISSLYRFHGHNSLRYVYANGKAVRSQALTIKTVPNGRRKHSRFSIVVSKKVIKSAVGRNRIRRRLYEYVRTHIADIQGINDVVIICTSAELRTLPYADIASQLDQLFVKAGLFKDE